MATSSSKDKPERKLQIVFSSDIASSSRSSRGREAASASSKAPAKGNVWQIIALATVPLVLVLGNSMIVPILPTLSRELNISSFQSSLVITLFSVTAGLIIPVAGYLSDRASRKAVLIPALIIYGGAGVLSGFAAVWHSYWLLLCSRAIQGIGAAGTTAIAMALVGDLYKDAEESKALGIIEASNGSGKVISPILGSLLALIVWYAAFFAFPIFCALSLLAVIFLIKEPKREKGPIQLKAYVQKIREVFAKDGRWLIISFWAGAAAMFTLFGVLFFLSNILEDKPYNIEGVWKGMILAIPVFGMVTVAYITGAVIKKNGVLIRWLSNIGLALMAASLCAAIWLNHSLYVFIGLLTVSSIGTGMLLPCLTTMITGVVDKAQRGMITSLYSSLRFLGVAFGPPLFGWLMEISHRTVFITVSSLSFVTFLLVLFFVKPAKQVK
ncbi:MFS transporter [Cohnella lubricantis]|uniref:MFS transporter n=1 Tax=Cohnella lubricantis TaxID=2163172 RepID=A0A841TC21_9BACL|nr:MFS transporter [Cohnella lubricantis]MBB6678844.1 MFS transporter [Cohnella lubricantis]MBP2118253.1 ACDE family multidrug resistance protein [Cohnella lubricantis]